MRTIHRPPALLEHNRALERVSFYDFAVSSLPPNERGNFDCGPANEWSQAIIHETGRSPAQGVAFPLGLLFQKQMVPELQTRQTPALETEVLMRNLLDRYLDALRRAAYFGRLGVNLIQPTEIKVRIPSVATPGAPSQWIGRDTAAPPTAIPTFADHEGEPHTLSTRRIILRSLMLYSGGVGPEVIRQDMSEAHAAEMQRAFLFGNPAVSANEPQGLLLRLAEAAFPAARTVMERSDLVRFIEALENSPLVDYEQLRWFFPQVYWRQLQQTPIFPDAERRSDQTVIPNEAPRGGPVLGYPSIETQYLRSNLGTEVPPTDCDLLFGSFDGCFWASWQQASVMASPYSNQPGVWGAGGTDLLILSDHDSLLRDTRRILWTTRAGRGSLAP
jgi:hypothetical protein